MNSSLTYLVLALCITGLVSATDYPLIGVVLLQSAPQYDAFGSVTLTQQNEGTPIIVEGVIFNLKPNSRFGLHVHEQGDLTNACLSAGAHFNPYSQRHGSERSGERHWGDFGNVASDKFGNARVFIEIPRGSLTGVDGYFGRALVLHEREDDLGLNQNERSIKTGDSGDRIACGVIGIRQPIASLPASQPTQWNGNNMRQPFRQ